MIREYITNKQIAEELIMRLIKNAHRAPSAGHTQVQEFIIVKDSITKKKLRKVAIDQEYVELAPVLITVCSNTSRSTNRYDMRGREFYSIIDGAFASMIILLSAVGAFEDDKVSQILELPKHVKPVGIICLGYPAETPKKLSRIDISKLVHFEKWY